jgi:hypothetical protein
MKDIEEQRRKFVSLLSEYTDSPPFPFENCPLHTSVEGETIIFVPRLLLTRSNAIALRETAHALRPLLLTQNTRIRVDCSDLTREEALRLWSRSSWADIRAGFSLFTSLPCSVKELRLVSPRSSLPLWGVVVSVAKRMLTHKLRSRLLVVAPL